MAMCTRMNEHHAVIFTLKLFEFILCTVCLCIHVIGINYIDEPLPHDVLSCGIFVCFLFHSLIGCVSILLNIPAPLLLEAIINSLASISFVGTSIASMIYAENDGHLMFMTDTAELKHPFFIVCRRQSVYALVTAILFGMHATLEWDMFAIAECIEGIDVDKAKQPLHLHFLPWRIYKWLMRYRARATHNEYV